MPFSTVGIHLFLLIVVFDTVSAFGKKYALKGSNRNFLFRIAWSRDYRPWCGFLVLDCFLLFPDFVWGALVVSSTFEQGSSCDPVA